MKIFISLPMTGIEEKKIKENIKVCKTVLREKYGEDAEFYTFFNPKYNDINPVWVISEALKMLSTVDILCLHPDWKESKGCQVEEFVAKTYNIPVVYMSDFLDKRIMNN